MINVYERIKSTPDFYRQLRSGDSLIALFQCLLQNKFEDIWSQYNYFVYVVEGRKIWHTTDGSFDLREGDCVFVRKGASIVEQFFEATSCFIFLFMPDEFICGTLQNKVKPVTKTEKQPGAVISIDDNAIMQAFFNSMKSYLESDRKLDQALLELKFKELILTLADDEKNKNLHAYFHFLLQQPRVITLQQVMEENFCYNLKLEEFAQLSARSLSAFKRDFEDTYHTSPGKWLLEKRLNHSQLLLTNRNKTVSEAAFESGFESASHFSRAFRQRFGTTPALIKQKATA